MSYIFADVFIFKAIEEKKIKFLKISSAKIEVNKQHNYFYQKQVNYILQKENFATSTKMEDKLSSFYLKYLPQILMDSNVVLF